jgi:hypothetical protein
LQALRESEKPIWTKHDTREIIGHFLIAARGVYLVAEALAIPSGKAGFVVWYQDWLSDLLQQERALWDSLTDNGPSLTANTWGRAAALFYWLTDLGGVNERSVPSGGS